MLASWTEKHEIELKFIQPSQQQNAYIERYNRTVRYDWLNQHLFSSITDAHEKATEWLWFYNNERPNAAISGITSSQKLNPSTHKCV